MNERQEPPHPPYEEYRTALGDHADGHAALDDLHASLHQATPRAADVESSVGRLRTIPVIEARVANWWDAPRTQNWLKIIADTGL